MIDLIKQPWPWYVVGPLIGLIVPVLLIFGNKIFGVSGTLRDICAACFPANISYFKYDWKKNVWNLFFAAGIFAGAFIAWHFLTNMDAISVNPKLMQELGTYGINNTKQIVPTEVMNWSMLASAKGLVMVVLGGFLIGFGTRYGGGCTSGHAISGISNLQWPSMVATMVFMATGVAVANFILPIILKW